MTRPKIRVLNDLLKSPFEAILPTLERSAFVARLPSEVSAPSPQATSP